MHCYLAITNSHFKISLSDFSRKTVPSYFIAIVHFHIYTFSV